MTERIAALRDIADRFDAVLVDQFGVLHNGRAAFPGARACLDALRARGAPLIALTNSGKRAALNAARLARLGFPEALFQSVVSSGELTRMRLEAMLRDGSLAEGARVLLLSRDSDRSLVEGLPLVPVGLGEDAALVLIAGIE
ncbi:MAG: TIGR01459 family HAD-type hydrolase, partial [Pseudomonadota bacterium]